MPLLPDLEALRRAADAVDATATALETDVTAMARRIEEIPWRGPRRDEVVGGGARGALILAEGQVDAERALAAALRRLATEVERVLRELAQLADAARRHLEELLRRARAAAAVAAAAAGHVARAVADLITHDPIGALHEGRAALRQAEQLVDAIAGRLRTLPEPHDPVWRQLGPQILGWRPL